MAMAFFHAGHQVCGRTFRTLHGVGSYVTIKFEHITCAVAYSLLHTGKDRFTAVKANYLTSQRLTARCHRNSKHLPHNTLTFEENANVGYLSQQLRRGLCWEAQPPYLPLLANSMDFTTVAADPLPILKDFNT